MPTKPYETLPGYQSLPQSATKSNHTNALQAAALTSQMKQVI